MIPHVEKGQRMPGLMAYLVGPGKREEHQDPHLVAGDAPLMSWYDDNQLHHQAGLDIGRYLEQPTRVYGYESAPAQGHVWHCSLALPVEDGELDDEQWARIASEFVDEMDFGDAEGTKAPCRWAAVRHGATVNGLDHVHVAVSVVREDGTRASLHNDLPRAQQVCRGLEQTHGLTRITTERGGGAAQLAPGEYAAEATRRAKEQLRSEHEQGTETRTWGDLGEAERRRRIGAAWPSTTQLGSLERKVRGAAEASQDEAEFVRRLRQQNLAVRPRMAEGTEDVVTGYSVAEKRGRGSGEPLVFKGGGKIAKDLSLTEVRKRWAGAPEAQAAENAATAAAEWVAAKRGRPPVTPGREMHQPGPEVWQQVRDDVAQLTARLGAASPTEDPATFARVAAETAGAFAAWSQRVEGEAGGPLTDAAATLGRTAQTHRVGAGETRSRTRLGDASMLLAVGVSGGRSGIGDAAMLRQLTRTARQIHRLHEQRGETRQAARVEQAARHRLDDLRGRLPMDDWRSWPTQEQTGRQQQAPAGPSPQRGSPLPGRLGQQPPASAQRSGRDPGEDFAR